MSSSLASNSRGFGFIITLLMFLQHFWGNLCYVLGSTSSTLPLGAAFAQLNHY
jgi:hypothetical protein